MDQAKRRELEERRKIANLHRRALESQRRWQARCAGMGPIVSALTAAEIDFALSCAGSKPGWQPAWMPCGGHDFLWDQIAPQRMSHHCGAAGDRLEALLAALAELTAPDDAIVVVYERERLALSITPAAVEHLGPVIFSPERFDDEELWVAHPGGTWIVRSMQDSTSIHVQK